MAEESDLVENKEPENQSEKISGLVEMVSFGIGLIAFQLAKKSFSKILYQLSDKTGLDLW